MINVVVISNNPANTLDVLSQQNDMSVTKILPTTIENIVEQIGRQHPDIFIIFDSTEENSKDLLCRFFG